MKALKTIGIGKAVRFVWYIFYAWLVHINLPPVRVWLLRLGGAIVGADSVIFDVRFANLYHFGFTKLIIGRRCFLGDEVMLDVRGGITLEEDVTISNRAMVLSHINVGYPSHPLQKFYPTKDSPVRIKNGSYIGSGAIVLPGVTLGRECVVGAGAVVTKDVPPHAVVVGVPARVVKKIHP